ncbi:vacuolar ATP synthase-like protein subunit H [Saccharata proteae CBS 121410]|uniref:V-type proton ATPase subunit H n=1 Tax=Saccharata proteae CBS 121410 TaxID=1314787 RepID=A0A6A5YD57_9PEZI|nr:vacuolar ATP synthase-like protein subunit H [Saccharata proteae CBS 121410]
MSLDPPAYISSLQNNIRARPISWEGAVRAKTITDADLKKIKSIDKVRKEQRKQTIEADVDSYVALLLGGGDVQSVFEAASKAKRQDIIQYMLVLTGDLIDGVPTFVSALVQHPQPFAPFLPLLKQSTNPEDTIPLLTSSVLSGLLSSALIETKHTDQIEQALPQLYTYLSTLAKSSDNGLQDIAVQEYSTVLRTSKSRSLFWKQRKETLDPLIETLRNAAGNNKDSDSTLYGGSSTSVRTTTDIGLNGGVGLQLLYHVLLVIWQLSFEGKLVGQGLDEEHDIITLYAQLLRLSPKEKTTRLLLSTLKNLFDANPTTLLPAATLAKLPSTFQSLQSRHLNDPDLLEDLSALNTMLDEYTKTQTTFDQYAAEVSSGHLRWSPPHRNPAFWRDNARRIIEEDKGALPRQLVEIMSKPWEQDKQVLAVGCNDVACLVKEVPEKRTALEKMGLKTRVMELMADKDESVRWESLRAVGEWLRYSFE